MSPAVAAPLDPAEREVEIRQMLTARSDRLVRQGRRRSTSTRRWPGSMALARSPGSHDAALAEEVRQLVRARNERRERQGLETLDVEAEVQRTLSELSP